MIQSRVKPIISDDKCAAALHHAEHGPVRRFPENILAELIGVPVEEAKRAIRRYKRKMKNG